MSKDISMEDFVIQMHACPSHGTLGMGAIFLYGTWNDIFHEVINLKITLKSLGLDLKRGRFLSAAVPLRSRTLEECLKGEGCMYTHTDLQRV